MIEERYRSMKLLFISDGGKEGMFVRLIFIYISVSRSSEQLLLILQQEVMSSTPGGFYLFTVRWFILTRQTKSLFPV